MTDLTLAPNLDNPDDIYEDLLNAHDGLSPEESASLNARLILVLANHIGDREILRQAIRAARPPDT
ncbi:MAG: DUF2783 domain-containing protein [Roseovarius sp.]|nr:DUF2783 domain-containing protein [Roseovarius sp.]MCY4292860.1 DUF2783 domain-containing protein [Roseovarius sp.]MCY4314606.1 DUF2783 domain-containing protein [Roseovarius sp.]